jgi:hypothetical protein
MFLQAVADNLIADMTLTALLSTYKGKPAIFVVDPAPENAEKPYIVVGPIIGNVSFDTKTTRGRRARIDIRCYAEATGSSALIETISERVRTLLHRTTLTISGHACLILECSGPISADEDNAYGRIVEAAITAEET